MSRNTAWYIGNFPWFRIKYILYSYKNNQCITELNSVIIHLLFFLFRGGVFICLFKLVHNWLAGVIE